MKYLSILILFLALLGCKDDEVQELPVEVFINRPNILLVIADDMGKDATAGWDEGLIKPSTPNIDQIRNQGLQFNNMWVYPTCSPTRSSIITGKYGYRTGVKWANDVLSPSETILQQYIKEETNDAYATAIIGKWHLSGEATGINPEDYGLDHYAGLIRGGVQNYYQWQLTEDGETSQQTQYTTKYFTDRSIDWLADQSKPWFLWLAFNAPHTPFHTPPPVMHTQGALEDYVDGVDPIPYYMAAIEALDFQVGRLLESIPQEERDNTLIIFIGDNGTPGQAAQSPYSMSTAKGSLYQGGVNVPMYISGAGVTRGGEEHSLVTSTDLFSTIACIAGVSVSDIHDSQSFAGLLSAEGSHREFQYAEMDNGTDDLWTISNGSYKLIVDANGTEELYHLATDPYEDIDLMDNPLSAAAQDAKAVLEAELLEIRN